VQGRLDELEGSLEGDLGKDSYLERFRSPIWKDILATVRTATGPHFQGLLATFNTQPLESLNCQIEPPLMRALSRAVGRLSEVTRNPALRDSLAVDELMKRISPIVMDWAAQQCKDALAAQALGKVPPWPSSVMQLVTAEQLGFSKTLAQSNEVNSGISTLAPQSLLDTAGLLESIEPRTKPSTNASKDVRLTIDMQSSIDKIPGSDPALMSLALDEVEMKLRRKTLRQATSTRNRPVKNGTPPIIAAARVERMHLQANTDRASWKSSPAATTRLN